MASENLINQLSRTRIFMFASKVEKNLKVFDWEQHKQVLLTKVSDKKLLRWMKQYTNGEESLVN